MTYTGIQVHIAEDSLILYGHIEGALSRLVPKHLHKTQLHGNALIAHGNLDSEVAEDLGFVDLTTATAGNIVGGAVGRTARHIGVGLVVDIAYGNRVAGTTR